MKLTEHGSERINRRTGMTHEDVAAIVEARAGVELGQWKQFSYLLFYSPPDQDGKIAVTVKRKDGTDVLVTVWDSYFYLPKSLKRPTAVHILNAKKALHRFLLTRAYKPPTPGEKKALVRVVVQEGHKTAYTHEAGLIDREFIFDREAIYESQRGLLFEILRLITEHADVIRRKVRIEIRLFDPESEMLLAYHYYKVKTLRERMEALQQPETV